MERLHLYKQHHLDCVNIPETVNNPVLGFQFPFHFKVFCTNKMRENMIYSSCSKSCY